MPTTTSELATSLTFRARDLRAGAHGSRRFSSSRRYSEQAGPGSFSTVAGMNTRPWLARLRRALREDLFVLHYQPIVSLRSGDISHYEALIRLADEESGALIPPCSFLPAAERYGLIGEIDRTVISKAIALMGGELAAAGTISDGTISAGTVSGGSTPAGSTSPGWGSRVPRVAVNLSALSITDPDMLAHIERELARHAVDPERLVIEVTETAAIDDMSRARRFCEGVHTLGSSVALDDFGAGFGSFQYLKHLPFHYLKIDGDFIRALPSSRKDQLVVQALVGVARGLGKRTIAEYVGDEPTLRMLRELGVDYAQGFEVGRPQAYPTWTSPRLC